MLDSDDFAACPSNRNPSGSLNSISKQWANVAGKKLNWCSIYGDVDILYFVTFVSKMFVKGVIIGITVKEHQDVQVVGVRRLKVVVRSIATAYSIVPDNALSLQSIEDL